MEFWFEVAAKIATYAAVLMLVGGLGLRWLLLPQVDVAGQVTPAFKAAAASAVDQFVRRCAVALVVALLFRAVAHTTAAFGLADAWSVENVTLIAFESQWGGEWRQQIVAALALAVAAALGVRAHAGRVATIVVTLVVCFLLPRLGHAAGETDRLIVHGAHIVAGGLWLGTLVATILATSLPFRELRPALLKAFAPVAMIGFATLAATGAFAAWTYLGPLSNLWTTTYGRLLGIKLLLVISALTLGGINWWRMHRLGRPPLEAAAILETAVAVGIVVLTGWLTETGHP
jgi:putative copper export protein